MNDRNYSHDRLLERAQAALTAHAGYVESLEVGYDLRKHLRLERDVPPVAILGMGRAGKDTAGLYLCPRFGLGKPESSSYICGPLVAHMVGGDFHEIYAERHQHREFWIEACNALRHDDLTRLCRWCLGKCDVAIGLRGKEEFAAVVRERVVDLTLWVDNPRVGNDITVEFTRGDCDVVIDNDDTVERFHAKLDRFGRVAYRHPITW